MKSLLFAPVLIALSAAPALAQVGDAKKASPTPSQPADYSQEPIVYEQIRSSLRYENDGSGTRDTRARLRVNTAVGLTKAGQLIFDYNAADEQLTIRSVRVIKPDGSSADVPASAVQDLTAPVAREAPMYTDAMQKHVTIPGLAVGDVIEYETFTASQPLMPGQFWQTWNFVTDAINLDEQVELNIPRSRQIKLNSPPGATIVVLEEGDRCIYHWKFLSLRPPRIASSLFPNLKKLDPAALLSGGPHVEGRRLFISTFQSWNDVAEWYASLEHDRRVIAPEVRAQADEIVKDRTTDEEKVRAIDNWVSRNIRYVSLSFGIGRYQPHAANEVLKNRYGDCKDKNTLLEALLEAEGIHADAALVNSHVPIDPDVPTPHQFDHVITLVPLKNHDMWLDSTAPTTPFQYLLPNLRGAKALVVSSPGVSSLHETPRRLPFPTTYAASMNVSAAPDKKVDAKFSLDTRGDLEVFLRLLALLLPPSQFEALINQSLAQQKTPKAISLSDLKMGDPTDTEKPFHVEVRMRTDMPAPSDTAKPSPENLAKGFLSSFHSDSQGLLQFLPVLERANSTVDLGGPKQFSLDLRMTVPPDRRDQTAFKPFHRLIQRDFAEYEFNCDWEGDVFHSFWRLNLRVPEIPAANSKEYASFSQEVVEALSATESSGPEPLAQPARSAAPAASPAPAPEIALVHRAAPPKEAAIHYDDGLDEYKRRDFATAENSFLAAVNEFPGYEDAWRELGRTRMSLRKYEDAEAAFRKTMELAPDKWRSYGDLAWSFELEKKYSDIVDLMTKRVASGQELDGNAHFRLGRAYLLMNQPERAVPELVKATGLLPRYRPAHFSLALAYIQLGQYDSAALSYSKGIEVDGSPTILNSAAYQLAVKNTHLELAEQWSVRSIKDVELELNQASLAQIQPETAARVSSLAAYWDTLGWIRFQKGDLAPAEKYFHAAWELADDSTIGYHLGRAYEAEHHDDKAAEAYAEALSIVPATRELDEDEKDARARLSALVGDASPLDARIKEGRNQLHARRSAAVENASGSIGVAQYVLMLGPDSKIADIRPVAGEDPLPDLSAALRSATVPQTFPDDSLQKLPRSATVSCPAISQPCTLMLMPTSALSRALSTSSPQ